MRGGGDFPTETGSQSAGTIMVIDDEPALRSVLCTMLEEITPDLILTDVMMPDIDGLTLIRRLRSESAWSGIPALVISAKTTTDDRIAAHTGGANGFLAKPFSAADLKAALRQLMLLVPE